MCGYALQEALRLPYSECTQVQYTTVADQHILNIINELKICSQTYQ